MFLQHTDECYLRSNTEQTQTRLWREWVWSDRRESGGATALLRLTSRTNVFLHVNECLQRKPKILISFRISLWKSIFAFYLLPTLSQSRSLLKLRAEKREELDVWFRAGSRQCVSSMFQCSFVKWIWANDSDNQFFVCVQKAWKLSEGKRFSLSHSL